MRPSPPVSSFGTRAFARIRFRLDPMPPLYAPQPWARSPVPSWSKPMRGWKTVATKRGSCVRVFPRISRQLMLRAASSPTTTTTASGLVRTAVADIIASIGAVGAGARLLQSGLLLSFDDGVGTVSVPGGAVSANKAAFIEESAPIPVNDLVATEATLLPHKLSSIFTLTSEMVSGSNAEALIADAKLRCVGLALDNVRFECQWRQCYPTSRPALQRPQRREDRRTNRGGGGAGARHHPQFAFAVWRTGVAGGRANRHAARYEGAGSAGPGSSRARSTRR